MATLAYHAAVTPRDFMEMDPEETNALAGEVVEMANQDAQTRMDAMEAQTKAITQTIADGVSSIIKSNRQTLEAIAKAR